jgi:serine protease
MSARSDRIALLNTRFQVGAIVALILFLSGPSSVNASSEFNPVISQDGAAGGLIARVIVKFKSSAIGQRQFAKSKLASDDEVMAVLNARTQSLGGRLRRSLTAGRAIDSDTHVVIADGVTSVELASQMRSLQDVDYAEVDQRRWHHLLPNDPLYLTGPPLTATSGGPEAGQWYLRTPRGEIASSINAPVAWDVTVGSPIMVVAVLDSGVRFEHPTLAGKLLPGYDLITGGSIANDGDARDSNATDPGDWVTEAESKDALGQFFNCKVTNSSWHGTKTSSLIGASSNDGDGMAGVAWGVKILPVRVLGKCGGHDSDIVAGMRWAAGLPVPGLPDNPNPARVINLSLGSAGTCSQVYIETISALTTKNNPVAIVASAGNSTGHAVGVPANCPGVIGVAALRHIGTKVGFSDIGSEISISAPGGNCVNVGANQPCLYPILTARNTGTKGPEESGYSDSFSPSLGTSFSAPLVSATIALMLSLRPQLTPREVKQFLQEAARPFPQRIATSETPACREPDGTEQLECYCTPTTCGAGMLDTSGALNAVLRAYPDKELTYSFAAGWNLSGNGGSNPIDVATVFGLPTNVESVWVWNTDKSRWSFYSPKLFGEALIDFLAEHHYDRLASIPPGVGYWLNSTQPFRTVLQGQSAASPAMVIGTLVPGWNLVSVGEATSVGLFSELLGQSASASVAGSVKSLTSLWAWDNAKSSWYFFSPALDAQGGSELGDFNDSKGYLDFTALGKSLTPGGGFWVNVALP